MNKKDIKNFFQINGEVIFTDSKEMNDDTNWFDWSKKQKITFAKEWNKLQDDLIESYGITKENYSHIIDDNYVERTVNLITDLEKDNNLTEQYGFDYLRTREQIDEFLSKTDEYVDPLLNSRHIRSVENLEKEYYMQNDYGDVRNVTVGDVRKILDEISGKTITPYKDFADEIDSYDPKLRSKDEGFKL